MGSAASMLELEGQFNSCIKLAFLRLPHALGAICDGHTIPGEFLPLIDMRLLTQA